MTPTVETQPADTAPPADLADAIRQVLADSPEPLTPAKIRAGLHAPFRAATPEELTECLDRQVAAQVFHKYAKHRSPHDRYWDRPMTVHVAALLREALTAGPLPLFEVRRRLPAYAASTAEDVLRAEVRGGALHRHPPQGKRGSERFGVAPPDVRAYLRPELAALFRKMEETGFTPEQVRAAALELLHEEEWAETPVAVARVAEGPKTWTAHPEAKAPAPHDAAAAPAEHP